MKKLMILISFIFLFVLLVFINGCIGDNFVVCKADAKICPNGMAVGRDPSSKNCEEFYPCPQINENDVLINNNIVSISCNVDNDCQLTSNAVNFICCGFSGCGKPNYESDEWLAVNKKSFEELKDKTCNEKSCKELPLCAVEDNNDFIAKCVNNICKKIEQGGGTLNGKVILSTGNCQPMACVNPPCEPGSCSIIAVSREVYVTNVTGLKLMDGSYLKNFLEQNAPKIIKRTKSNSDGTYIINLPVGEYSLFVEDNGKLYCGGLYDRGVCVFEIKEGQTTLFDATINHAVY